MFQTHGSASSNLARVTPQQKGRIVATEPCTFCGHLTKVYSDAGNRLHYVHCKLYEGSKVMTDEPKFYWTARADDQLILVTFYRQVQEYDQREREYYPSGKKLATRTFTPAPLVQQDIQTWAKEQKKKYLTENAAGIVASTMQGKHYV